mgnify:CR=1 FL=1
MNFGDALQALKSGKKLYRQGWDNGAQFIFLVPGSTFKVNRPPLLGLYPEGTEIEYNGHIDIMTTNGFVQPWTPTHNDLLSGDWQASEDKIF